MMSSLRTGLLAASAIALALTAAPALAQDVAREDTVIFDLDRTIQDPDNFNWMTDGTGIRRMQGAHQAMWEPLFILNYGSGELDPWLATGYEANDDSTEFTITLRDGVTWSDGEPFNADDVVFTTEMAMGNEELNAREVATIRSQVASVE
ncbi:MAG: ABC transporter substrate-binding protein, partial [Pseudomonadota bacterium]